MVTTKLVPPDGGYGWIIMGAYALNHLIAIPVSQSFGLIFKDRFKELGFSATDNTIIMNVNTAFYMFMGIINGPLIRNAGYRKVSLMGASFSVIGIVATAFCQTFVQYIIAYGIITAIGLGMGMSSYPIALNSYFMKKRAKAAGYAMTIAGFGPIFIPQLVSFLLYTYGQKGGVIIMAGIAAHSFISGSLLQPIRWHMIEEIIEEESEVENEELLIPDKESIDSSNTSNNKKKDTKTMTIIDEEETPIESAYGIDTPFTGSMVSIHSVRQERTMSVIKNRTNSETRNDANLTKSNHKGKNTKKDTLLTIIGKRIVEIFDLTLLTDPTFVNIMMGMSLAIFAELNFSMLTPFIMQDYGLTTQQIATFMSTLSIVDICFRFIAPYVSDFFKLSTRTMYGSALVLLIFSRVTILVGSSYTYLLGCAVLLGFSKGFRAVYWTLVIPSYVPIERLPAALGLQSTVNSIFVCIGGPFLGFIRDATGSYVGCIIAINFLTTLTIVLWSGEYFYKRHKSKKMSEVAEQI